MWHLGRTLAVHIVSAFYHTGVIRLVGDETVTEHPGKKVFGKGRHRHAKRSTHSYIAHLWGNKWVVLAILVDLPGTTRPWALPVLVALYRNEEYNQALGLRHKAPTDLMRQLLGVLRVSPTTRRQPASQMAEIVEWLSRHGLTEESVGWYEDIETGKTMLRPAMQRLQSAVQLSIVETVIIQRLDRLSRRLVDGLTPLPTAACGSRQ